MHISSQFKCEGFKGWILTFSTYAVLKQQLHKTLPRMNIDSERIRVAVMVTGIETLLWVFVQL